MKFRGYKLLFENREAAESMVRQIDEFPSFFTPTDDRPLIIDCGANIGVSVLEWKTRWPGAEIVCFEPDPFAFKILQANMDANDIPSVRCINAAVSDCDEQVPFYGDVSVRGDARGNSIDPAWGQRDGTAQTMVKCKRLSNYIAERDVAFLKLDIEGAEQRVLTEIAGQLDRVAAIYVEVHETDDSTQYNSSAQIEQILRDSGFCVEAESRFDDHALPRHLDAWKNRVGAKQVQLLGWR
ncbi:methyltransferase FkbM family [Rhodopirellula maiorica SM1]|uniref:Methyltransferase FkbM family n=2 Tax=Novipirellula TaxID=2795426 RepID=M5S1D4_9BACT|nr:methyltransferase FkbM family [Rhodopirellula maiorica SM1]